MEKKKTLAEICISLFLLNFAFSFYLSRICLQNSKEIYYLPSIDYLESVSGSFRPLFAEMIFIKGVLRLPEKIPHRMNYLLSLFNASIHLDPNLINAYFLGGVAIASGKEEIAMSIKFLKGNILLNPYNWKIPFWIGFDYFELGNYDKAVKYYRIASSLPHSPDYLRTNLAFLYYKASHPREGLLYLEGLRHSIKDRRTLKIVNKKIEWLKRITILEAKVEEYRRLYGTWPSNLEDLIKGDLIEKVPDDPFGKGYYLEKDLISGIPKVRSNFH